jgi:transposase
VSLAFEEGPLAQWVYETTLRHVQDVIVCDPRQNRLLGVGSKSDDIDADKLSELLRLGALKPVYHATEGLGLKELVQGYSALVKGSVQEKNQLKALFRSRAIDVAGSGIYRQEQRDEWLEKLEGARRQRATWVYELVDTSQRLRGVAQAAMLEEAKKHPEYKLLVTVPGIGPIRAATLRAYVGTPHRFRTKRQFWAYVGLAVLTRTSADYVRTPAGPQRKLLRHARGLNPNHHPALKMVFKSAALEAVQTGADFRDYYLKMIESGIAREMALLTIARKLAAITLRIWKTGEVYDQKRATQLSTATP